MEQLFFRRTIAFINSKYLNNLSVISFSIKILKMISFLARNASAIVNNKLLFSFNTANLPTLSSGISRFFGSNVDTF